MIVDSRSIRLLKDVPNSAYRSLKIEFLYNSNKLEGSTFTKKNLEQYLNEQLIEGTHHIDDVIETTNSTELFDFLIDTLNEPISKRLILEFHRMLKDRTLDYKRGFSGCWKKIPNQISGVYLKLAQPWEVEYRIEDLINAWEQSDKDFEAVLRFHASFENIHPFQDGNGRIGRFLMLKQCIENEIDLIMIDDAYSKVYKQALYQAQKNDDFSELEHIFRLCQKRLNDKLKFLQETLDYLKNNNIKINTHQSM